MTQVPRAGAAALRIGLAALLGTLSSCMVGPDYERPGLAAPPTYTRESLPEKTASTPIPGGEEQRFVKDLDIPGQWWTLFQSAPLSALIDRALQSSPTLAAAHAALRQARELAAAQEGLLFPTLQASFVPSYQKSSGTLAPPLNNNTLKYALYNSQLSVGYTLDVFGGTRRALESMEAQAEFQRFQLEAAVLTLTANLVVAAVQEASLRAQIGATREVIAFNTKSLDLLRRQLGAGAVTGLEVAAQEAALAQVQQTLPPLEKQLEQNRDLLLALAGGFPNDRAEEPFDLTGLHLPENLPVSLPSKLVEQRPDVRAAEAQLHSSSALIGVAVANRLPQFTISAAYGGLSTQFGRMFDPGNTFWSVMGSATQTLLSGGTLMHQQRAAEAAFDQASANYRGAVLTGFQNVADTLYALQSDADSLKAAVLAERSAKVTLGIVQKQVQAGQVNYLSLLSAQAAFQQAAIIRVQAQAIRLADTAALFQALGGGWWNRPALPEKKTER